MHPGLQLGQHDTVLIDSDQVARSLRAYPDPLADLLLLSWTAASVAAPAETHPMR
jgi:hypothetical protein